MKKINWNVLFDCNDGRKELPRNLLLCLSSALLFYFLANGMTMFSIYPQHDWITDLLNPSNDWQLQLGRWMIPVYNKIFRYRGLISDPLLTSLRSVLFIGLSLYLIADIADMKNRLFPILGGALLSANVFMTSSCAVYKAVEDVFVFANLLMCLGVWVYYSSAVQWKLKNKEEFRFVLSCVFFFSAFSIYQAAVSYALILIVLVTILQVLDGSLRSLRSQSLRDCYASYGSFRSCQSFGSGKKRPQKG